MKAKYQTRKDLRTIGCRIEYRMGKLGIRQGDLAKRIGSSSGTVYAWVNLISSPRSHWLKGLSRELETTREWLKTGYDENTTPDGSIIHEAPSPEPKPSGAIEAEDDNKSIQKAVDFKLPNTSNELAVTQEPEEPIDLCNDDAVAEHTDSIDQLKTTAPADDIDEPDDFDDLGAVNDVGEIDNNTMQSLDEGIDVVIPNNEDKDASKKTSKKKNGKKKAGKKKDAKKDKKKGETKDKKKDKTKDKTKGKKKSKKKSGKKDSKKRGKDKDDSELLRVLGKIKDVLNDGQIGKLRDKWGI